MKTLAHLGTIITITASQAMAGEVPIKESVISQAPPSTLDKKTTRQIISGRIEDLIFTEPVSQAPQSEDLILRPQVNSSNKRVVKLSEDISYVKNGSIRQLQFALGNRFSLAISRMPSWKNNIYGDPSGMPGKRPARETEIWLQYEQRNTTATLGFWKSPEWGGKVSVRFNIPIDGK